METMIACCGLTCDDCPIHLATIEPDQLTQQSMRESIAEACTKLFGVKMKPVDVNDCDGCRTIAGSLFSGCLTCEIRKCASLKNIENCAYCCDYACETLTEFFSGTPFAKNRLEKIRNGFKT